MASPEGFTYDSGTTSKAEVERWLADSKPSSLAAARSGIPWIWCRDTRPDPPTHSTAKFERSGAEQGGRGSFETELDKITQPFTQACQRIEDDLSIKIHGKNSKAQQRQAETTKWLKAARRLAQRHGVTSGKWMIQCSDLEVDRIWGQVCRNMILPNGHLHGVSRTAKVCSSSDRTYYDKEGAERSAWIVIIYSSDSWDEELVRNVLAGVLKSTGCKTTGYKTDVTTLAGIYAPKTTTDPYTKRKTTTPGHPSKMSTTLYKPTDMLEQSEIDGKAEQPAPSTSSPGKSFSGAGNTLGGGGSSSSATREASSSFRSPTTNRIAGFGSLRGGARDDDSDDDDGGDPGREDPFGKTGETEPKKEGHAWPETGGASLGGGGSGGRSRSAPAPSDHEARRKLAAAAAARREAEAPKVEKPPPPAPKPAVVKPVIKRPVFTNSKETAIELDDTDDDEAPVPPPAKRAKV